jgi:hypothetical protein
MMVFTDDNWDHARLAIGEITNPTGGSSFGLVADTIVGRLVASNELIVENENNSFIVSGSGVTLYNADFTVYNQNYTSKIVLNPEEGIFIAQKNPVTTAYEKKFYVDSQGNIIFSGNLEGASGTFSGSINASSGNIGAWHIDNWGLYDDFGNYIYGDGRVRLGMLTIDGNEATFNGNIYADNLLGLIEAEQIGSINAGTITAGVLAGIDIYGKNIYWPGVRMYSAVPGSSNIEASQQIAMYCGNSYITITPSSATITGNSITNIGNVTTMFEGNLNLWGGTLYINAKKGVTGTYLI